MEGVGLVSIEGHPLLVRTLSGEFPTTYLLTLFSSEKFAKEQSDCSIILSESDTKKIGWRKKFEFILIGWFCKETNDEWHLLFNEVLGRVLHGSTGQYVRPSVHFFGGSLRECF